MKRSVLLIISFLVVAVFGQAQEHDVTIVKDILKENNLEWDLFDRIRLKNGRIVTLNLDNKEFHLEGITTLSPKIGNLTELKILTLNDNDLKVLPENLFKCTQLRILEVKNNELIEVSESIGNLLYLKELDLRNNEFRFLPNSIVNLKSLVKLHLWGNELEYLPERIGRLSSLRELYLRGNRLITMPVSITNLNLTYLDFLENYLCDVTNKKIDRWLKRYDDRYKGVQYCVHNNQHL